MSLIPAYAFALRASPRAPVHHALALCGAALQFQRFYRGRLRQIVQRHIDEGRHPTRSRCPCRRHKPFPLRAPWLIHMDMPVDEARKQGVLSKIIGCGNESTSIRFRQSDDLPQRVIHDHRRGTHFTSNHDTVRDVGNQGHYADLVSLIVQRTGSGVEVSQT